jgi:hypothetical protein
MDICIMSPYIHVFKSDILVLLLTMDINGGLSLRDSGVEGGKNISILVLFVLVFHGLEKHI